MAELCKIIWTHNERDGPFVLLALLGHREALRAHEEARAKAEVLRAHLKDADGIKETLAKNPPLYLRFLKTILAEFAQRKEMLLQARKDQLGILEGRDGDMAQLHEDFTGHSELIAEGTRRYEEQRSGAEHALQKIEAALALLGMDGQAIAWEIEQVEGVWGRLKGQQGALQRHVQNWAGAGAEIDYARLLSERVVLEVLAIRQAREEILGEILAGLATGGEVRQITMSFDLTEALEVRRKAILAEHTRVEGQG